MEKETKSVTSKMTGLEATRSGDSEISLGDYTPLETRDSAVDKADSSAFTQQAKHMNSTQQQNGTISSGAKGADHVPTHWESGTRVKEGEEEEDGGRCKWGPFFSPPGCQRKRRPVWVLLCLCWAGFVQGMAVNGFINVVISTLERRFHISSTESGTIASCYDIAAVICLIPVSYFGGRGRKPLYLGLGMLVLGVGSFVFLMPHFTTDLYEMGEMSSLYCDRSTNTSSSSSEAQLEEELSNYKFVFYLAQLLHGAGASPLYTLGVTYMDENLPVKSSSFYNGIFFAFSILGPGVGYLLGGVFLGYYTDVDKLDTDALTFDTHNPRWVGAWWMGFFISAAMACLITLPLIGFPKSLPGSEKYRAEKEKEVYKGKKEKERQSLGVSHILNSAKMLMTNPTFMMLNLAAASDGATVSGFSTFGPKYIEFQFSLPSGFAAQLMGLVVIPGGGGATFLGGYLIKRFDFSIRNILKFSVAAQVATVATGFIFLITCSNIPFAGVSNRYQQQPPSSSSGQFLGSVELDSRCNQGCGCSVMNYNPVCGRDHVLYFSPCHAGCESSIPGDGTRYGNCSCVHFNFTAKDVGKGNYWQVEEGKCKSDCPYLPLFLVFFLITIMGIFITSMPALSASLRCVTPDQRSFALGIQWIIARCLGSIPGPIVFGKVIDTTCLLWERTGHGDGACLYYDNQQMSWRMLALGTTFNALTGLGFFSALVFYHSQASADKLEHAVTAETRSSTSTLAPPMPMGDKNVDNSFVAGGGEASSEIDFGIQGSTTNETS